MHISSYVYVSFTNRLTRVYTCMSCFQVFNNTLSRRDQTTQRNNTNNSNNNGNKVDRKLITRTSGYQQLDTHTQTRPMHTRLPRSRKSPLINNTASSPLSDTFTTTTITTTTANHPPPPPPLPPSSHNAQRRKHDPRCSLVWARSGEARGKRVLLLKTQAVDERAVSGD